MKLKNLLGFAVATGLMLASASSVFAADKVELGQIFDVTENKVATEFVDGHILAVPYDVTSETDSVTMYEVIVKYDNSVFSSGLVASQVSADEVLKNNIKALAGTSGWATQVINAGNDETLRGALVLQKVYDDDEGGYIFPGKSVFLSNTAYEADKTYIAYNNTKSTDVSASVDGYLFFVVKDSSKVSDSLNFEVMSVDTSKTLFADLTKSKTATSVETSSDAKANACAGAFNIKIDATELTSYVQALYVQIGDAEAVSVPYYTVDGDIYKFPVRVLTTKDDASVDVKVLADTSSDLDGKNDAKSKVSLGTITVTLNSPSDYADSTIS